MSTPEPGSVLHISACDSYGGSGRAAYRIHTELRRQGWRSRMLVARRQTHDPDVAPIWGTQAGRLVDRACGRLAEQCGVPDIFYPSSLRLSRHPWLREADVLQLYNLHGGYVSYTVLRRLSRLRPVVWRLSDMWALTGHCGYSYDCGRWKIGCGACPFLDESPALSRDTTALLWRLKRRAYEGCRLTLVTPSRWLANLTRQSPLLQQFPVRWIAPGIDLETFSPALRSQARTRLGLPTDGHVVLFIARSMFERRKGIEYLVRAMGLLASDPLLRSTTLLVAGEGSANELADVPVPVRALGVLSNDQRLATAYAAADIVVVPTLADNLPNVVIESLACATPVVAFDVGGCREAVRHMETGYLASAGSADDLSAGLRLLLADRPLRDRMGATCRRVAEEEYALPRQIADYATLYRELSTEPRPGPTMRSTSSADLPLAESTVAVEGRC